jgi:hypothetical protein
MLQDCLKSAGYVLDQEFCDSEYKIEEQIEKYKCYERIGLSIAKDRLYCEIVFKTSSEKKYECLEDNNLPLGGEYCYITYPWDNLYDELYDCLD